MGSHSCRERGVGSRKNCLEMVRWKQRPCCYRGSGKRGFSSTKDIMERASGSCYWRKDNGTCQRDPPNIPDVVFSENIFFENWATSFKTVWVNWYGICHRCPDGLIVFHYNCNNQTELPSNTLGFLMQVSDFLLLICLFFSVAKTLDFLMLIVGFHLLVAWTSLVLILLSFF